MRRHMESWQEICFSTKFCLKSFWSRWKNRGTNMRENNFSTQFIHWQHGFSSLFSAPFKPSTTFRSLDYLRRMLDSTHITSPQYLQLKIWFEKGKSRKPAKPSHHGGNVDNKMNALSWTYLCGCIFGVLSVFSIALGRFFLGHKMVFSLSLLHQACSL